MARESSAPALWRYRRSMGRVWFTIAIAMCLLGLVMFVYGVVIGDVNLIASGLGLLVGGALLAVGFRRKGKGAR